MSHSTIFSDEQLLMQIRQHDEAAFEALYNRYWERLYVAAYKRVFSAEVAEEIVQDFFTSLWLKRHKIEIKVSFEAYVFTAVRYLVLNHLEKEKLRTNYRNKLKLSHTYVDNSTEELVFLEDLKQNLQEAVAHLPNQCRSVYTLSREKYKTNREIARELGISEKTVENHLTKALRKIRLSLNNFCSFLFF